MGIDLSLEDFLVTSEGNAVASPQSYRKAQRRLRQLQKAVSSKVKGSTNKLKAIKKRSRQHQRLADTKKDFIKNIGVGHSLIKACRVSEPLGGGRDTGIQFRCASHPFGKKPALYSLNERREYVT